MIMFTRDKHLAWLSQAHNKVLFRVSVYGLNRVRYIYMKGAIIDYCQQLPVCSYLRL